MADVNSRIPVALLSITTCLILFLSLSPCLTIESKLVIFDNAQSAQNFTSNTCHYTDYYEDYYWGWGCPAQIHEYDFKTESTGFWSNCKRSSCQLVYYAPELGMRPSSISILAYVEGDGELIVYGKRTPLLPIIDVKLSSTWAGRGLLCAGEIVVDLENRDFDMNVLKVVATSGNNGYVLIDRITVCFNEDGDSDEECYVPASSFESRSVGVGAGARNGIQCKSVGGAGGGASGLVVTQASSLVYFTIIATLQLIVFSVFK